MKQLVLMCLNKYSVSYPCHAHTRYHSLLKNKINYIIYFSFEYFGLSTRHCRHTRQMNTHARTLARSRTVHSCDASLAYLFTVSFFVRSAHVSHSSKLFALFGGVVVVVFVAVVVGGQSLIHSEIAFGRRRRRGSSRSNSYAHASFKIRKRTTILNARLELRSTCFI